MDGEMMQKIVTSMIALALPVLAATANEAQAGKALPSACKYFDSAMQERHITVWLTCSLPTPTNPGLTATINLGTGTLGVNYWGWVAAQGNEHRASLTAQSCGFWKFDSSSTDVKMYFKCHGGDGHKGTTIIDFDYDSWSSHTGSFTNGRWSVVGGDTTASSSTPPKGKL